MTRWTLSGPVKGLSRYLSDPTSRSALTTSVAALLILLTAGLATAEDEFALTAAGDVHESPALASPLQRYSDAENLIPDPGFDGTYSQFLVDWPEQFVVDATWSLDSGTDFNDDPGSNSGWFSNQHPGSNWTVTAGPCIDGIDPSQTYTAGVYVFIESGHDVYGDAFVQLVFKDGPACSGTALDNLSTEKVDETMVDEWFTSSDNHVDPPSGTQSLGFYVTVARLAETTTSFNVNFDEAWLVPILFADGFESGDTAAWSYAAE